MAIGLAIGLVFPFFKIYILCIHSNQTLFATFAKYNKCGLDSEMLTYKPFTNSELLYLQALHQQ
jgi:hypothetical protein